MIEFHGVSVRVPLPGGTEKTLLEDVELTLGEPRIAVVGPNGSGKSTLLRLINGLLAPATGQVLVDGIDVAAEPKRVRRRVGFVFTDALAQLIMVTPIEDIELSLRGTIKNRRARAARAQELLDAQGLGDLAHESIYALSGGERQLVALTSVLATEPSVLVCDEPTTLLDLANRNRIVRALGSVAQQVVYATHDLDFAAAADRALLVAGGRIRADGKPADVISAYRESVA